jgi:hypothetical protein
MALATDAVELGLMAFLRAAPENWPIALAVHVGACAVVAKPRRTRRAEAE